MQNKKVYLAKNILASGFDVEYVKSHLQRIPGIVIIEAGMGVKPEECNGFVIVPNAQEKFNKEISVILSKNVFKDLQSFLENFEEDCPEDYIYIFQEPKASSYIGDIEKTVPFAWYCNESSFLEVSDKNDHDNYGTIEIENSEDDDDIIRDSVDLLYCIGETLEVSKEEWITVPRHRIPFPQFAVPPVPSIEERLLKKHTNITFHQDVTKVPLYQLDGQKYNRRLLLLRRK